MREIQFLNKRLLHITYKKIEFRRSETHRWDSRASAQDGEVLRKNDLASVKNFGRDRCVVSEEIVQRQSCWEYSSRSVADRVAVAVIVVIVAAATDVVQRARVHSPALSFIRSPLFLFVFPVLRRVAHRCVIQARSWKFQAELYLRRPRASSVNRRHQQHSTYGGKSRCTAWFVASWNCVLLWLDEIASTPEHLQIAPRRAISVQPRIRSARISRLWASELYFQVRVPV